ncbi:MAG: hypothetical protein WKG03_10885 [Telluria sp.]
MTTEQFSRSRCMKVGAMMACVWGVLVGVLHGTDIIRTIDIERPLHVLFLIGSLAIVAVGFPAFRNEQLRNQSSLFFLTVGIVLMAAVAAVIAFLIIMILLSGWHMPSHN